MTQQEYVYQKMQQKVGELERKNAELEFVALLLKEENEKLKSQYKKCESEVDENEETA